jgi:crotonobetainyl-CoA:carnitine CoA-transferase CaiB-like acyl-CoA transferase
VKPLAGVRVLDLTHAFSGPLCTYLLQLLGADVVKVERVGGGDEFRHFYAPLGDTGTNAVFIGLNAGKRSLTLDLKSPAGRDVLERLIRRSDVLVQNYRPGAAAKIGADWESCAALNDRLVYCAISGFGQTGPLRDWPAYDHTIQAISGLMSLNGSAESDHPVKVGFTLIDFMSGHVAHSAILAALLQRANTGRGQNIDVAMLDSALLMMTGPLVRYTVGGELPVRVGNRGGRGAAVVTLKTGDGWLFIGANFQSQFVSLCRALRAPDLLNDPRFATEEARDGHRDELAQELERLLAARSALEWEAALMDEGCPAGAVRTLRQIAEHPHLASRDILLESGVAGWDKPIRLVNAGYEFAHGGPGLQGGVPALGEHSGEVLSELGLAADEIEALRQGGVV